MKPVGNVCTENVVYVLEKAELKTEVDKKKLSEVGNWICNLLERPNLSIL
jgi:isopropylmalate/homocitrate/citramalate synthase